jgi:MATE family multidrug resistance protein
MTIILHIIFFIPIATIIMSLKYPLSLAINENERAATSDASQTYLYFLLPSSLFAILYEAVKAYMIAHKIFSVFMYI